MATVYGSKVNSVWRSYLTYTITDNPTNVVVELVGGLNLPDAGYTSKRIYTSTLYQGSTSIATGTYNSSGSTLTGVLTQPIATQTVTINKTSSTQSFTFKNVLSGSGTSTKSTASYTLQVPAVTIYTVTYYANGGSGTVPSAYTSKVANVELTLPNASQSGLTRSGYTLVSWNTAADGSGTSYALGGSLTANADTTLYAIWRKNYVAPTITSVEIFRTTSSGTTQTDDGTYIYIKFNYTNGMVDGISTLPSCSIKIGTTTYTPTLSGGSFTSRYSSFSANDAYEVTIMLSNAGYTSQATVYKTTVPSATYPIDILGTGQSMGIMHVAVSGQKLTIPDTYVDGDIYLGGADASTGGGIIPRTVIKQVPANGTTTISSQNARYTLTLIGGGSTYRGMYLVAGYNTSVETKAIASVASGVVTTSGSNVVINNNENYAMVVVATVYVGSVTMS